MCVYLYISYLLPCWSWEVGSDLCGFAKPPSFIQDVPLKKKKKVQCSSWGGEIEMECPPDRNARVGGFLPHNWQKDLFRTKNVGSILRPAPWRRQRQISWQNEEEDKTKNAQSSKMTGNPEPLQLAECVSLNGSLMPIRRRLKLLFYFLIGFLWSFSESRSAL